MTCPNHEGALMRRSEVSVERVCESWGLGYNMGKVLEDVRDSVHGDPARRAELLRDARERIDREISKAESHPSGDIIIPGNCKCMVGGDPGEDAEDNSPKASDNMPAPKAGRPDRMAILSDILFDISGILAGIASEEGSGDLATAFGKIGESGR